MLENIHPAIVHFPIALLLTAGLIELAAWLLHRPALHLVSLWNCALGALGAAVAVWSGLHAEELSEHTAAAHEIIERHETLGRITLIVAVVVLVLRLAMRKRMNRWMQVAVLVLMLTAAASAVAGGYLGGRLVYEFGVGTPAARQAHAPHEHHHHESE